MGEGKGSLFAMETSKPRERDFSGSTRDQEVFSTVVCIVVTAGVIFFAGFLSGRNILLSDAALKNNAANVLPVVNWGDTISVDGKTENVTDFFAAQLSEQDIKNYLS